MTLEELQAMVEQDTKHDPRDLGAESMRTMNLIQKYIGFLANERLMLKKRDIARKKVYKERWEYYAGRASPNEYKRNPIHVKILRGDISTYLDADTALTDAEVLYEVQKTKVEYLENVVKALHNRNYTIKNAIDWHKFMNGMMS